MVTTWRKGINERGGKNKTKEREERIITGKERFMREEREGNNRKRQIYIKEE